MQFQKKKYNVHLTTVCSTVVQVMLKNLITNSKFAMLAR